MSSYLKASAEIAQRFLRNREFAMFVSTSVGRQNVVERHGRVKHIVAVFVLLMS